MSLAPAGGADRYVAGLSSWRLDADLASFDRRVRRDLEAVGPRLSSALSD